jgi:hypothetical protein
MLSAIFLKTVLKRTCFTISTLENNGIFTLSIELTDTGESVPFHGNYNVSVFLHPEKMLDDFICRQKFRILHHEQRPLVSLGIDTNLFVLQKNN